VDWWDVPGRDDAWKDREIANLGSEEAFNQQYGCQFLSSSSLLLSSEEIKMLQKFERDFEFREFDDLDDLCIDYSQLKWDPEFDIDEIESKENFFVISIDLAEGVGRDYTVFNIFKIESLDNKSIENVKTPGGISDFFGLSQVAIFRSNLHNLEDASKILYALVVNIFDQENLRLIIEYNTYGSTLIKNLTSLYPASNDFDEETIVRYHHRIGAKVKNPGLRLNKDNKKLYCDKTKALIKGGRIILKDKKAIDEACLFSRNPNGSYSAQTGNDDIFMTTVNASSFFDSLDFDEIIEEYFDHIDEKKQNLIENLIENSSNSNDEIYDIF
jgi:hypothetical protein